MLNLELDFESNLKEKQEKTLKQELSTYLQALKDVHNNKPVETPKIGSFPLILDKYAIERVILLYRLLQHGVLPAYQLILDILRVYTLDATTISDDTKREILAMIHNYNKEK